MPTEVELFGNLAPGSQRLQTLELEHPFIVRDVVVLLGLNPETVGLIVIDGIQSELEDVVPLTARLCFFPPLSGG
jgi:hypothetical protein